MAVMPELQLDWDGTTYRCRASMDVIMHIEQKVTVQQLAHRIATGAASGDIPLSHIAWVMFCLLRQAGAPVYNVSDVWDKLKANRVDGDTISAAMKFIIDETFGVGPSEESAEELSSASSTKKKTQARKK